MAVGQLQMSWLTYRYRAQAPPHLISCDHKIDNDPRLSIYDMFVKEHAIAPISCVCA